MDWVGVGEEGQAAAGCLGRSGLDLEPELGCGCNCNGHHLFFRHIQEGPMRTGDEAALHVLAP